jgi:lactate permease
MTILTLAALAPLLVLIFLMTKKNAWPSAKALPFTALITYLIVLVVFGFDPAEVHGAVLKGLLTAFTPIMIIWGAIFLFRTMEASGSMNTIRNWLNGMSRNPVAQLMIVGWAFPFLLEGASGFGTPVAIAAPILVGLGFPPLRVALLVLVMNTAPVSFGAVGTPTWFGFSGIDLSQLEILEIGIKSAWIHGVASLVVPLIGLSFIVSWRTIRRNLGFILLSILATIIPFIAVAYGNYEFPALVGGFVGTLCSVFFARKGWGLERPAAENGKSQTSPAQINDTLVPPGLEQPLKSPSPWELAKAALPMALTLVLLVVTRIPALGLKALLTGTQPSLLLDAGSLGTLSISASLVVGLQGIFGTAEGWSHQLLYVPSLIPFGLAALITVLVFRMSWQSFAGVWSSTLARIKNPAIALFGALVFVELLTMGGDISGVVLLGRSLAQLTGGLWTLFASLLGALGAFFSGSNTISNLTFGGIQDSIAVSLGLNRTTTLALQSVGGAMGHMIALHSIVAVSSVLDLGNQEGTILKRILPVLLVYAVIAGILGLLL